MNKSYIGIILAGIILLAAGVIAGMQGAENIRISGTATDNAGQGLEDGLSIGYHGHVDVYKIPAGGKEILVTSKDNLLVDNGKNYIRTQIGSGGAVASNSSSYISLSNSTDSPAAGWVQIPSEISTNGLARAQGTYAANGTGAWNMTYTWTATGSQDAQLTGLNYASGNTSGALFAALTFTNTSLQENDQLRVVWSISVS